MQYRRSKTAHSFVPLLSMIVATLLVACSSVSSTNGGGETSYTLKFAPGENYNLYASIGGGTPHQVQLDTGSIGLFVPEMILWGPTPR